MITIKDKVLEPFIIVHNFNGFIVKEMNPENPKNPGRTIITANDIGTALQTILMHKKMNALKDHTFSLSQFLQMEQLLEKQLREAFQPTLEHSGDTTGNITENQDLATSPEPEETINL